MQDDYVSPNQLDFHFSADDMKELLSNNPHTLKVSLTLTANDTDATTPPSIVIAAQGVDTSGAPVTAVKNPCPWPCHPATQQ